MLSLYKTLVRHHVEYRTMTDYGV